MEVLTETPVPDETGGKLPKHFPQSLDIGDKDAQKRLLRLALAVECARAHIAKSNDNDQTLKIFMAPEFYFRPQEGGPEYTDKKSNTTKTIRSYSYEVKEKIIDKLGELFSDDLFKNWIFVPGTIVWYEKQSKGEQYSRASSLLMSMKEMKPSTSKRDITIPFVMNAVVAVRGGYREKCPILTVSNKKKYAYEADDIPKDFDPNETKVKLSDTITSPLERSKCIVDTIPGLLFGLEICREHQSFMLRNYFLKEYRNKNGSEMNFHLLTSCGAGLTRSYVAAKSNGYALHVDGSGAWPDDKKPLRSLVAMVSKQDYENASNVKIGPYRSLYHEEKKPTIVSGFKPKERTFPYRSGKNSKKYTDRLLVYEPENIN